MRTNFFHQDDWCFWELGSLCNAFGCCDQRFHSPASASSNLTCYSCWNFDTCIEDRVDPISAEFVGKPGCEYALWKQTFRSSFVKLYQGDWTRAAGHGFAQSRLDRIFSSLHPVTLSDMVVATEIVGLCRFDMDLSDHKPVRAVLQTKTHQSLFPRRIPAWIPKHACWTSGVAEQFSLLPDMSSRDEFVQLSCVKAALHRAAAAVPEIGRKRGAVTYEERLCWGLAALRFIRVGDASGLQSAAEAWPKLGEVFGSTATLPVKPSQLRALQDLVVEVALAEAQERLEATQSTRDFPEYEQSRRISRADRILHLWRGKRRSSTLSSVRIADGSEIKDEVDAAKTLTSHLKFVFWQNTSRKYHETEVHPFHPCSV